MKKIYILALVAFGFAGTVNAQIIEDDFEDYLEGTISDQGPLWRTWSDVAGSAEDSEVVTDFASNGDNSMALVEGNDMLLAFNGEDSGVFTWQYKIYLNEGSTGFLGLMSEQGATNTFALQFRPNDPTNGQSLFTDNAGAIQGDLFDISEEEWHTMTWTMDMDDDTAIITLDGSEIYNGGLFLEGAGLLWVDVWANDASTDLRIDEVIFSEGTLATEDFNADVFSAFPNPVVDVLNINSKVAVDAVVVYDILGKVVLSANPGVSSPVVDMSSLASGAYLVNVTIGDASKTIKVIK